MEAAPRFHKDSNSLLRSNRGLKFEIGLLALPTSWGAETDAPRLFTGSPFPFDDKEPRYSAPSGIFLRSQERIQASA